MCVGAGSVSVHCPVSDLTKAVYMDLDLIIRVMEGPGVEVGLGPGGKDRSIAVLDDVGLINVPVWNPIVGHDLEVSSLGHYGHARHSER
jgi:hypothetical protein